MLVFFSIEYKAGKAIPADVMTQLESLPVINADSRVYLIGLSQSSSRMRRMGQVPIVKFGIKVVLSHEQRSAKTNHNRQQQKKQMDEIDDKDDIVIEKITTKNIKERQSSQLPPKTSSLQPEEPNKQHENKDEAEPLATHGIVNKHKTEVTALDRFLARYNGKSIENFVIAYKASCSRLWGSMGRVFDRTTDNFPEKFYRLVRFHFNYDHYFLNSTRFFVASTEVQCF